MKKCIRFAPHLRRGQSGLKIYNTLTYIVLAKLNPLNEFVIFESPAYCGQANMN